MLASPIQQLAYGYDAETLHVAGPLLAILGVAVIFNCMVGVTNAILQAHGQVNVPIYTTLVGGLVNIVMDYVLIGMDVINIYGAAIATIAYCAVIMFLNIAAMHKTLDLPPRILMQFVKPMVATAVMAVGAYLSYEALQNMVSSNTIATCGAVAVACMIYAVMVYVMKIITWYDCQLLPKGELIARILRVKRPERGN